MQRFRDFLNRLPGQQHAQDFEFPWLSASTAEGSSASRLMASSWSMSGLSAMRPAITSAIARSSASGGLLLVTKPRAPALIACTA